MNLPINFFYIVYGSNAYYSIFGFDDKIPMGCCKGCFLGIVYR